MDTAIYIIIFLPVVLLMGWAYARGKKIPQGTLIDKIVVHKKQKKMMVYSGADLIKSYHIALGKDPVGHKLHEGDNKTPEGRYSINDRNPLSKFHKNLGISYPNEMDKARAASMGLPPGGDIKIHGVKKGKEYLGRLHVLENWTAGCIAITNQEIDELYAAVKTNAVIDILP